LVSFFLKVKKKNLQIENAGRFFCIKGREKQNLAKNVSLFSLVFFWMGETDEFEHALVEMGLLEDEAQPEDAHNDLVIEALLGSRVLADAPPLVEAPPEEALVEEPLVEAPLECPPAAAPPAPAPSAPVIEGELHDMISLLAAGKDIGAPASGFRDRIRQGIADRIERKRAGYTDAEPKPHTPRRTYAKKPKLASKAAPLEGPFSP
jgi:hypothetical protein